ncbi:MAG TPA: right-handed parallel beta-helix repeat-containing protein, partial [Prosthecobacter sp.]|nr:right-handed parallel beta-helix repeat-containing protein [Prosthecobacter sp.]
DGAPDAFTKKPKPYVLAIIQEVRDGSLLLKEPLQYPIPAGAVIRHADAPNLIEIRGASDTLEIANLTLDGGRADDSPKVRGHAQLCGIFAAGPYTYEKGPSGPKPKGITVRDCILQNLFGRGIAFYSVEDSSVERCSIRDVNDEAIDFDHFATGCVARGNHIIRSPVAFELNDANTTLIVGNEVRDCGIGVNLWRWCQQPGLNEGNIIRGNLFARITGNAFQLGKGTARNVIEANEIDQPGRNGISLSGAAQIVRGNLIRQPGLKDIAINEGDHQIEAPSETAVPSK